MKKTFIQTLIVCLSLSVLVGCTKQQRAKQFGGSMVENLPAGQKLVNATWKESHLWILTKNMTTNDTAETYTFKESSNWGLFNGEVIIKETK